MLCKGILTKDMLWDILTPTLPGKPLTPYHKKRERQEKIVEDQKAKETKPKASGVFVQYNEPKKFSPRRDNCNVIRTNRQFE